MLQESSCIILNLHYIKFTFSAHYFLRKSVDFVRRNFDSFFLKCFFFWILRKFQIIILYLFLKLKIIFLFTYKYINCWYEYLYNVIFVKFLVTKLLYKWQFLSACIFFCKTALYLVLFLSILIYLGCRSSPRQTSPMMVNKIDAGSICGVSTGRRPLQLIFRPSSPQAAEICGPQILLHRRNRPGFFSFDFSLTGILIKLLF